MKLRQELPTQDALPRLPDEEEPGEAEVQGWEAYRVPDLTSIMESAGNEPVIAYCHGGARRNGSTGAVQACGFGVVLQHGGVTLWSGRACSSFRRSTAGPY